MQSTLEELAIAARQQLLTNNIYNDFDINNNYSATHTRAKSDDETPVHGKGTGTSFDSYNGGGSYDIYGAPNIAGSGRLANVAVNEYNSNNEYTTPDTSGNLGQVIID
tara:strand:+ start:3200 stop:3523 length:324 start_codon:yes stop_codon:yes gene_type:complete